jgi:hypothetical protein
MRDCETWLLLTFAIVADPLLTVAPGPVRAVVALLLAGVVPGYAVVRLLHLHDAAVVAVASIATSLSITTLSSLVLGYLGVWSPPASAAVLAAVTACAALAPGSEVVS